MASLTTSDVIAFSVTGRLGDGMAEFRVTFSIQMVMSACSLCRFGDWCEHRAYVIASGMEISPMHDWFSLLSDVDILVPIFPSKGLYLAANIAHAGYALAVNDSNNSQFYGVIGQDEGLNAMRNLYFDHITNLIEMDATPTCNGSHGVQAQRAEAAARDGGGVKWLAYVVTVALKSMCEVCSRRENYDDLVPDVPANTGRPNPWAEARRKAEPDPIPTTTNPWAEAPTKEWF